MPLCRCSPVQEGWLGLEGLRESTDNAPGPDRERTRREIAMAMGLGPERQGGRRPTGAPGAWGPLGFLTSDEGPGEDPPGLSSHLCPWPAAACPQNRPVLLPLSSRHDCRDRAADPHGPPRAGVTGGGRAVGRAPPLLEWPAGELGSDPHLHFQLLASRVIAVFSLVCILLEISYTYMYVCIHAHTYTYVC